MFTSSLLKHGDECFEPASCPCLWKGKEYYPGDRVSSPCHQWWVLSKKDTFTDWALIETITPHHLWAPVVIVYKFVLASPVIHLRFLSGLRSVSNKDANFSESNSSWKVLSPESESGHLISIILWYGGPERGRENRTGPCSMRSSIPVSFGQFRAAEKKTLSQWSQSFSHPSISSSGQSRRRRRWQANCAMSPH